MESEQVGDVLRVQHVSKHFGGARALDDVSLSVASGEIHALLGQNGSGKSTLIKCLAGFHLPEPGWEFEINGRVLHRAERPGEFHALGMSFVHQDLGLVPTLTVVENMWLGHRASQTAWWVNWGQQARMCSARFEEFGVEIDPWQRIDEMRPVDRALVAIVRALDDLRAWQAASSQRGGLLVLDEPTVHLDRAGKNKVADLARKVAANKAGVLFVSHDLKEVLEIAHRVTVLRDGRVVDTVARGSLGDDGVDQIIELMTGRRIQSFTRGSMTEQDRASQAKVGDLTIEGLTGGAIVNFSTTLVAGEILGLTGLVGMGWEDVPLLLFGAKRAVAGRMTIAGQDLEISRLTPALAISHGLALVPADRQAQGLIGMLPVKDNVAMPVLGAYVVHGMLRIQRMTRDVRSWITEYDVVPPDPDLLISALSGGNQQKAILSKWLTMRPRLLLLLEPTQGVDVASRQRILEVVRKVASSGTLVIYATADHAELARIADRVLVVADGRVASQLRGDRITEDNLLAESLRATSLAYSEDSNRPHAEHMA